ncbi:hypothetical protein BDB00DRAFT_875092 [Zychaea mexicana]|uniref:uncharacterized protein n=1 Tax=Zychaea mexicana TaxID=64656 RepID=UPI0022FE9BF8|nr:uncharacterized protein BDB00DRAFT_875092 [Zychaea mexicana]KAI9490627.1 hypothetical protein BDB00DRAFT_875092 [Zychaea mexicana]
MWKYLLGKVFVTTGGKAQNQQQATSDSDTTTMATAVETRPSQPSGLMGLLGIFGTMKRQIFGPCYDPYQRDQVAQKKQEQEEARDERPTKGCWSLTSLIVNNISTMAYELFWNTTSAQPPVAVTSFNEKQQQHHHSRRHSLFRGRDIDFTHFKTSSAWENRMQEAERLIRGICLQNQQQQRDSINDPSAWAVNAALAYQLALEEDNNKWGLVNKEDLEVCFLALTPPPKPKRTYVTIPEASTPPGVPHNYQHPRNHPHLFHDAVVLS